ETDDEINIQGDVQHNGGEAYRGKTARTVLHPQCGEGNDVYGVEHNGPCTKCDDVFPLRRDERCLCNWGLKQMNECGAGDTRKEDSKEGCAEEFAALLATAVGVVPHECRLKAKGEHHIQECQVGVYSTHDAVI